MISTIPRATLNRRTFLKVSSTAGSLLVGSFLAGCAAETLTPEPTPTAVAPPPTSTPLPDPTATPEPEPPFQPNLYIRIDADGTVTLTAHRSEMGQGVRTALAMILAEELEADWASVRVEQLPGNPEVNQITSGSGSVLINYAPLREAGAIARAILIAAAAETWGASADDCQADQGTVVNTITSERLSYGELVRAAREVSPTPSRRLKDPGDFRLIGTSVPRVDDPAIVTGQAVYGLDVRLPGLLFATIARSPVQRGTLAAFDSAAAEAVPGVRAVVPISNGVAVVAENTWAAIQGRAALDLTWDDGALVELSTETIRAQMTRLMDQLLANEPDSPLTTLEAVYETPYLAHAPMEPMNCVAHVTADKCDIWAPTQNPLAIQEFVQEQVNVPVNVNVTLLGGGFGRRLEVDFALEAVEVSQAVNAPVQVVWTRDDDLQHDFYRQATYHWMRAGWDADNNLQLWRHYVAGQGINGLAYHAGPEVLNEGLPVPYEIPGQLSRALLSAIPLPTGPWRAVVNGPNAFANESFFDEIAAALERDPLELRLEMLAATDRLRPVLELAADRAGWGSPLPEGRARGIACHTTWGQTDVAMVAEVSVNDGVVRVHRVVCALDCGLVIHPDMVAQQMEGGIALGLSSLMGEITFDGGRVQQSNFNDFPLLRLAEMPEVEVHILPSDRPPQGVGEMGVPPIVPAVLNAVFAATGVRLRRIPIRPGDLS